MITKTEILSKLTELRPILYKDYAVKEIGLFGSYSHNSNTEESDVDILIELENRPSASNILGSLRFSPYFDGKK